MDRCPAIARETDHPVPTV